MYSTEFCHQLKHQHNLTFQPKVLPSTIDPIRHGLDLTLTFLTDCSPPQTLPSDDRYDGATMDVDTKLVQSDRRIETQYAMFETEDQLLRTFDVAIRRSDLWVDLPNRKMLTMKEVGGIHGCVDRMIISLATDHCIVSSACELLRHETCCRIFEALNSKRPKSTDQVANEIARSNRTVHKWLSSMTQASLARRIAGHRYVRAESSSLPNCKISSFEGKLRDWKRALYQATRYRAFSHRSFVVMPEHQIKPAKAQLQRFKLARVGLIAIDRYGRLRILHRPRPCRPRCSIMFQMARARVSCMIV